jgi:hypothetical protein
MGEGEERLEMEEGEEPWWFCNGRGRGAACNAKRRGALVVLQWKRERGAVDGGTGLDETGGTVSGSKSASSLN